MSQFLTETSYPKAEYSILRIDWVAIFVVIVAIEHFVFRKPDGVLGGYNFSEEGYNDAALLPPGFACIFAISCGIAGAVVGMASTYWIGPIALLVTKPDSDYGGDLVSFCFFLFLSLFTFRLIKALNPCTFPLCRASSLLLHLLPLRTLSLDTSKLKSMVDESFSSSLLLDAGY